MKTQRALTLGFSLGGVSGALSCAPPAPADPPQKPAEADPAQKPHAFEAEPEEESEPPVSEPASTPSGPSPTELVSDLCEEVCEKVQKSCSARSAEFCRASCGDYVSGAEKCPSEVHAALGCQVNADDFLLCSNIAAESCAPKYRDMKACREGEARPRPWGTEVAQEESESVPSGFARLEVAAAGFSVFAPTGAKVVSGEGGLFSVNASHDGVDYVIDAITRTSTKKPTDASILRTATEYVESDCQPKVRLHGRYETGEVINVRFDTVCADGTEIRGMLHFWGPNIVAQSARRPGGAGQPQSPDLEPFLFSFRLEPSK